MNEENLKPFQPGQSGNPAGRQKGSRNRATIYRELLEAAREGQVDKTNADAVVAALLVKALDGDVPAAKELMDSAYGKVSDKTELTGKDGGAIEVKSVEDILKSLDGTTVDLPCIPPKS